MAYHFFLALFPALIFLLTLIPYVPINGLEKDVEVIGRSIISPAILIGFELNTSIDHAFLKRVETE